MTVAKQARAQKTLKFTQYSEESFVNGTKPIVEKFVKSIEKQTKRKKQSRKRVPTDSGIIKTPKCARTPQPIAAGDLTWRSIVPLYDPLVLDRYYRDRVVREFCAQVSSILHERLEPGYAKFGYWKPLGSCNAEYLNIFFSHQTTCKTWDAHYKEKHDGEWVQKTRKFYYFQTVAPNLGTTNTWYIRDHGPREAFRFLETRTFYTQLVFIVNTDGRVFYHYSQMTQAFCNIRNQWMDVA